MIAWHKKIALKYSLIFGSFAFLKKLESLNVTLLTGGNSLLICSSVKSDAFGFPYYFPPTTNFLNLI